MKIRSIAKASIIATGNSKSFTLLLVSAGIAILTFLTLVFWEVLRLGDNKIPLALALTVSFGISIAGIIFGISELRAANMYQDVIYKFIQKPLQEKTVKEIIDGLK